MEEADNVEERREQGVNIRKFDRSQYFTDSGTCNLEQVTEVPNPLRAANSVHQERLKALIRVNGFDRIYAIITVTTCGDSAVVPDSFVVCKGRKFLKNGMDAALVDGRHRFAALAALRTAGKSSPCQRNGLQMALVRRPEDKAMSPRKLVL